MHAPPPLSQGFLMDPECVLRMGGMLGIYPDAEYPATVSIKYVRTYVLPVIASGTDFMRPIIISTPSSSLNTMCDGVQ